MAFLRMSGLALAAVLGLSLPDRKGISHARERAGCCGQTSPQARRKCALGVRALPLLVDRLGLGPALCAIRAGVGRFMPMPDYYGWRRPLYAYAGQDWGWRRPFYGYAGYYGWRRPYANWGWRRPLYAYAGPGWGWRRPFYAYASYWGWRRPFYGYASNWGWRRPFYGYAGYYGWRRPYAYWGFNRPLYAFAGGPYLGYAGWRSWGYW